MTVRYISMAIQSTTSIIITALVSMMMVIYPRWLHLLMIQTITIISITVLIATYLPLQNHRRYWIHILIIIIIIMIRWWFMVHRIQYLWSIIPSILILILIIIHQIFHPHITGMIINIINRQNHCWIIIMM